MSDEKQPTRRFEPPPWEREAFERFERERAQSRAAEELEAALAAVRADDARPAAEEPPPAARDHATTEAPLTAAEPVVTGGEQPGVSERQIQAMLVELRVEEPTAGSVNMTLINAVVGFLGVTGLFVIVQAALLFAGARTSEASGTMLAATLSFLVLLAGVGFLAGAVMLFRKYHR
ncbi:MAG TPA: hypothetical protein VLQ52_02265 [Coriobacteriia bacterium]|nr:hypothetical protein [Coriobacteriia bacterium]